MTETTARSTAPDREALRAKYAQERDKRLRVDGNAQYLRLTGDLVSLAGDPYTTVTPREPVTDEVTFLFIGGGFAGLLTAARLKEAGVDDVRIVEKAGGFGGTWYWNRYPGAQCDTASLVYMPLLEETGHMPTEKYAHAPEILEHCERIGKHYNLYDDALFHTEVTDLCWDEEAKRWLVTTNRGDAFRAQYVGMGTGPLHIPKLPGIPGIRDFAGHAFHTSRWDYGYTGGDPLGAPMTGLANKRVALIGTGATSVQCVPHLARACQELFVVQRTPSSVDVRNNGPIDPDWFAEMATPGWQQRWLDNFTANQSGFGADEDLVQDGWTELARRIRGRIMALPPEQMTPENMMLAYEDCDHETMERIRGRVDEVVGDPTTAHSLKAWYRQLCKRPCFHDDYLAAFNEPGVQLVDTDGRGVERITERGIVVAGREYAVDCIIYASGFEVGSPWTERAGYDLTGRDGELLSRHWSEGMRTLHGMHTHGFPNAFVVQPNQGANLISNVPHNLVEAGRTIAEIVRHAREVGAQTVEVSADAEQSWMDLLDTAVTGSVIGSPDCTPGYYNNEGLEPGWATRLNMGYPDGATAYFAYL
ncbi:MAG: NAD(P)/FAD-dependent oxidoreductase, partial [Mycobacteriales bacterium]